MQTNAADTLTAELEWLGTLLQLRLKTHFEGPGDGQGAHLDLLQTEAGIAPPDLSQSTSPYANLVRELNLGSLERALIALALAPHLQPGLLDCLFIRNQNLDRGFTELGGWRGELHGGFLPTWETGFFLLFGDDVSLRLHAWSLTARTHPLQSSGLLLCPAPRDGEPALSAPLTVSTESLSRLLHGEVAPREHSAHFPATPLTTRLSWDELVLPPPLIAQIAHMARIASLMPTYRERFSDAPASRTAGMRGLFVGPAGAGKSLCVALMGQSRKSSVYEIDALDVLSLSAQDAEIGFAHVLHEAQRRNWLLTIDRAELLFPAQPPYALHPNVARLLRRLKTHPADVIWCARTTGRWQEDFLDLTCPALEFSLPDASARHQLWSQHTHLPDRFAPDVDLAALAENNILSGHAIALAVRGAALHALGDGRSQISMLDLRKTLRI